MSFLKRRLSHSEYGQVIALFAFAMIALLSIGALAIDLGFLLHAYNELQISTNAAAAAGALDLPNSTAVATATAYSGLSGDKNAYVDLPNVSMVTGYPTTKCLTTMVNYGLTCSNAANATAIAVVQQAAVPTYFARVFGVKSVRIQAEAMVAMRGGSAIPSNVMVILDSTSSMGNADSDPTCKTGTGISSPSKLDCAKWGLRTMLNSMSPCAPNLSSCGSITAGNVPNPVQQVGLLTFPGVTNSSYETDEYTNCGKSFSSSYISMYGTPTQQPPYFTVVSPSSDYRTSDTSALNGGNSPLVQAIDWKDGNNCTTSSYGLQSPGGAGTYYAGVITEASNDLAALTGPRASMQNAIILLSDGDATSTSSQFTSAAKTANPSIYTNECHQAVSAAQGAAAVKNAVGVTTWVISVAFGSSTSSSSSCSTDSPAISGCTTMSSIASSSEFFYSDNASGCASPAHSTITALNSIFNNITYNFQTTRLLPWNTN